MVRKAVGYWEVYPWELIINARRKLSVVVKNEMFAYMKTTFRDVIKGGWY
jgi:hypothetical protein